MCVQIRKGISQRSVTVGLLHVFDQLKENEQKALRLRYEEHKTLQETADAFGLSRERVRQIAAKGLRKLRHPTWLLYYRDGFQATLKRWEDQAAAIRNEQDEEKRMHFLYDVRTEDCFFSTRVNNCLIRGGYCTDCSNNEYYEVVWR
jgi:hypothetical protein